MNLPSDFRIQTESLIGDEAKFLFQAIEPESPTSIRINKRKTRNTNKLNDKIMWCDNGYYLSERPQFTFDPLFHAGNYYVQEASSMFIGEIINKFKKENSRILDLCAAPGGKSTLIADSLDNKSLLVSNEVIRSRANILVENMTKWGNPNVIVANNDPAKIGKVKNFFDIILVDAPCSGEGMFRKDEMAISEWSLENVKLCKERQQRIIADIWSSLKGGGILIYSTCTYNLEENEKNVQWMCDEFGAENISIDIKEEWKITPSLIDNITAYRFFPHKTKGEGFFCAILRKPEEENATFSHSKNKKNKKNSSPKNDLATGYKKYLLNDNMFKFYSRANNWHAIAEHLYDDIEILNEHLNILSEGVNLGEFKGKDFIPSQSLAMSTLINKDSFLTYELTWEQAIAYLRKEALLLPDQPKGYILLTYEEHPLGFVKNIGNRANNLYPQEWRIRSGNIPDKEVNVLE
ncbi:rRNA cytosine-C5-methyltransferase [Dysgonomonas sp. Marseille-P4361]|uniref:methyltransferase RsmF C-terminal domain-like protein n=1 Tax=Dysgonomonas sp. Marseille-P4361 TaxID=2161820 RepID=UPI000D555430|nr:rRNA cytosine-C5-methyltransferase [Dysgonomonas sp. Marseille-P4361]